MAKAFTAPSETQPSSPCTSYHDYSTVRSGPKICEQLSQQHLWPSTLQSHPRSLSLTPASPLYHCCVSHLPSGQAPGGQGKAEGCWQRVRHQYGGRARQLSQQHRRASTASYSQPHHYTADTSAICPPDWHPKSRIERCDYEDA